MIKFKITLMTSMTFLAMSCADAEKPKSRILSTATAFSRYSANSVIGSTRAKVPRDRE